MNAVNTPVAGGKQNFASAVFKSKTHSAVEHLAVCRFGLVAVVVLQKVTAVFRKGHGIEIFVVEAARIIGAGADTGAGIHTEFESLGMDIVADRLHSVGEFFLVGNDLVGNGIAVSFRPAVVDDEVVVSGIEKTVIYHRVGGLLYQGSVDVVTEGVPGVIAHRGFLNKHFICSPF